MSALPMLSKRKRAALALSFLIANMFLTVRARRYSCVLFLFPKSAGADFEEGKRLNKKMVLAESLPGKVAPLSAGEIIAETILNAEEI